MAKSTPETQMTPTGIVAAMNNARILVVGDIMLDRFVYGEATRISPESPVPVLSVKSQNEMAGGAGNVISNLRGLGVQVEILAVTGKDQDAKTLRDILAAQDVRVSGLIELSDRPTTIKTRFLAQHQHMLRVDAEKSAPIDDLAAKSILTQATQIMDKVNVLVLSDYGKGVLRDDLVQDLIRLAKKHDVTVLVDPKKTDYRIYKGADIVTPNRKELSEASGGAETKSDEQVVAAARKVMKESGIQAVLATRSQDGMSVIRAKGDPVHLRTQAIEVFDVSGAGDTVIATVAACLAAGATLEDAASIANHAAGIVVAKIGTAAIQREELLAALEGKDSATSSHIAPVCDWNAALETIKRWRARGLKVGFTNGCFDILHRGHVTYLNQARAKCDRLIVGLNADESVRRLKGPTRPVNDEDARAIVMAGLGCVDMVVLFGSRAEEKDQPSTVLDRLRPDIFFKGGDYTESQLPEAAVIRAYGGEIEIMGLVEGHSTTGTIAKLAKKA